MVAGTPLRYFSEAGGSVISTFPALSSHAIAVRMTGAGIIAAFKVARVGRADTGSGGGLCYAESCPEVESVPPGAVEPSPFCRLAGRCPLSPGLIWGASFPLHRREPGGHRADGLTFRAPVTAS